MKPFAGLISFYAHLSKYSRIPADCGAALILFKHSEVAQCCTVVLFLSSKSRILKWFVWIVSFVWSGGFWQTLRGFTVVCAGKADRSEVGEHHSEKAKLYIWWFYAGVIRTKLQ